MKQILNFVTNNWTLRMVLIITGLFVASSLIFEKSVTVREVIITFLVSLYLVWGYGKKTPKADKKTHHNTV